MDGNGLVQATLHISERVTSFWAFMKELEALTLPATGSVLVSKTIQTISIVTTSGACIQVELTGRSQTVVFDS
jgi:hypothetical protein